MRKILGFIFLGFLILITINIIADMFKRVTKEPETYELILNDVSIYKGNERPTFTRILKILGSSKTNDQTNFLNFIENIEKQQKTGDYSDIKKKKILIDNVQSLCSEDPPFDIFKMQRNWIASIREAELSDDGKKVFLVLGGFNGNTYVNHINLNQFPNSIDFRVGNIVVFDGFFSKKFIDSQQCIDTFDDTFDDRPELKNRRYNFKITNINKIQEFRNGEAK